MIRCALCLLLLVLAGSTASAKIAAPPSPVWRAIQARSIVIGKVTAIEKEPVSVKDHADAPQPTDYTIALVKIEQSLLGAEGLTHVKVGYRPKASMGRRPVLGTNLAVGDELIFFLTKHPVGGFSTFDYRSQPVPLNGEGGKEALASVKRTTATLAHPKEALTSKDAAERTFAAAVLILKARLSQHSGETKDEPFPREESRAILTALGETDWTKLSDPNLAYTAFNMLSLTPKDGWNPKPLKPGQNFMKVIQDAYRQWLQGPGKDYVLSRIVPAK